MKIIFKKIASVLASATMLLSTAGFAAAATTYPSPFTSGAAVVYGVSADKSDVIAAIDIYSNLKDKTGGTVTTVVSASGGDNVNLASSSRKIYYGDAINVAKTSLTSTELPNVLSASKFTDLSGTQYSYTQTIKPGPAAVTFGTSGGDLNDPKLHIDGGDSGALTAGHLYNYTLSFSKNINVSDTVNVQGQKIKILGVDYVIGSGSTNTTLYLYGSGESLIVNGGEETKVTIAGTEHVIELVTTSSATAGTIKVDGVSKSVTEGNSYAYAGNLNVFVKDIIHPAYAGDIRQAELIIGSNTLLLQNGQTVKQGADQTSIKGTLTTITSAGNVGVISGFAVQIGMAKTQTDALLKGETFTDPVFGGLKIQYAGATPELDDEARGKIALSTDNNQYAYVSFTSARAGEKGEQKLTYTYDNNTASTAVQPLLAHTTVTSNSKGKIHVLEGEYARQNDWIVINQGDSGTILNVDDISVNTVTEATVTFSDVITGESQKITLTNSSNVYGKTGVNFYGGNNYNIYINESGTVVNVTWSSAGTRTVFPRIKLKNGGWLAFLAETIVANNTAVIFPDGQTTLASGGTTVSSPLDAQTQLSVIANGINWTYTNTTTTNVVIQGTGNPVCNFNSTRGPGILFIEPKKWDDSSFGNYICVPMTTSGTTEIALARAVLNGSSSGFTSLGSDAYKSQAVDKYGSFISDEQRTNENGVATITYPASQMYVDILFTSEAATVTPGTTGTTTGTITFVKDTEVDSVSDKNLIVIGGSCINTVAAKILDSTTPLCEADFTTKTGGVGAGQYIIKTVKSPYNENKIAMLVAGYHAADTISAVNKVLSTEGVTTDADTSQIYPIVTATA